MSYLPLLLNATCRSFGALAKGSVRQHWKKDNHMRTPTLRVDRHFENAADLKVQGVREHIHGNLKPLLGCPVMQGQSPT